MDQNANRLPPFFEARTQAGVSDLDPGFWWPKIVKNLQLKKFDIVWSKIAIYLYQSLHKGRPSYMRSLQPSNENIQPALKIMKFLHFFLLLRVTFALLDPDPDSKSGSTDLIESDLDADAPS